MAYNPDSWITGLQPGLSMEGVVIDIKEGPAKAFLTENAMKKWKGGEEHQCINVVIEGAFNKDFVRVQQIFTFMVDSEGKTITKGNLALFLKWYGQIPKVGMKVKLETDANGYWRLKYK